MHWIIQRSIFKPNNYEALIAVLDRFGIDHTSVAIPNGTLDLVPDVIPAGKVYVCGALKLARISRERGWVPGSFLNDQFSVNIWLRELGAELLNAEFATGTLMDVATPQLPFFIRPLEDNKAFDGMLMDAATLADWRQDPARASLHGMQVIVSPAQQIYREYRLFVVNREVVTGSLYKVAGRAETGHQVEEYVRDYVRTIVATWLPAESCVIDVGLTDKGLKVIEFNNINSSGFYASDLARYVDAIQTAYA